MNKLSFCTTCMNRTMHLKETLPINIELIKNHNAELVLVNYDSKDDMDEYIKNNYQNYIDSGLINYIKINNKDFFNRFHAKNIAHKYSNGDVLINLDADNFLTEEVIKLIEEKFEDNLNCFLQYYFNLNEGFIAISRENFFKLGGYNEEMKNWGFEDNDLKHRATTFLNCELIYINKEMVSFIDHSDEIRFKDLEDPTPDKNLYVHNINIFNDYYIKGIINPNKHNNIDWGKLE